MEKMTQHSYLSNTNLHNSFVCFWMAGSFKRWVPDQAFVAEDPDAPQVHLLTVSVTLNHLWREVVQSPAHCLTSGEILKQEVS